MKYFTKEVIAAVIAVSVGLLFFQQTLSMPKAAYELPRLLVILIVILSFMMVFNGVKTYRDGNYGNASQKCEGLNYKRVFVFGLIIFIYIYLIEPIGYFIVTPIFIIVSLSFLRATKFKNIVLIAVFFTVFIYLMFVWFLKLPVPLGIMD